MSGDARVTVAGVPRLAPGGTVPTGERERVGYRPTQPVLFVIFGATGDLARRKLLPALCSLIGEGLFPDHFAVVGASRDPLTREEFRWLAERAIREHSRRQPVGEVPLDRLLRGLDYERLDVDDDEGFRRLGQRLDDLDRGHDDMHRIYYCATPPTAFGTIVGQIGAAGMAGPEGYGRRRIVIEKPFGFDLASARALNGLAARVFGEESVYRIDHYLGKETVQNIIALRFANTVFEPLWNNHYVDHVQVTVAEQLGIEGRAAHYEQTGALRDMVQNHLLQLLALVAMEPPLAIDHVALRDERLKLLRAVAPLSGRAVDEHTVRGQYQAGLAWGQPVPGYRQEPEVAADSETETYTALRLHVDNWRWSGVPFYLRTGKRLARQMSEILVEFKLPPHSVFRQAVSQVKPNAIVVRIQPEEGITLHFGAKTPAPGVELRTTSMDCAYRQSFGRGGDAYEHLLIDCMLGDPTYFLRADEVEQAWVLVDPIEERWRTGRPPLAGYPAGSWGPPESDRLMTRDGRRWHNC